MVRTSTIVTATVGTAVAGALGYAIYFDYKRRNDPAFRNKLRKEHKRTEKAAKRDAQQKEREEESFIEDTVKEMNKPGALPTSPKDRDDAFMQSVSVGEALAAQGPDQMKAAAVAFYRGLKVYTKPAELLMIYRQAVPEEILDLVRRMVAKDVTLSDDAPEEPDFAQLLAQAAAQAPGARGAGAGRLEEIDDDDSTSKAQGSTAQAALGAGASSTTSTPPADSNDGNKTAPSVSSQEWEKVSEHHGEELNVPAGSYAAAAASPVTMPHEREGGVSPKPSPKPTSAPLNGSHAHESTLDATAPVFQPSSPVPSPVPAPTTVHTNTTSSAPAGSYAAAAAEPVDIPLGQGDASSPVPQPHSENVSGQ